jgi:hypothetical protein
MNSFKKAALELVRQLFDEGRPGDIKKELKALMKKHGIGKKQTESVNRLLRSAQKTLQDEFIERFTKDFTANEIDKVAENFEKGVLSAVRRGIGNANQTLAEKLVRRLGNTAERHLGTVVQTAQDGIAQAQKFSDVRHAGIEHFRYSGPSSNSRPFCVERVGKLYSRSEIEAMNNGQGLPVMYFGGGYNCRHRWTPVAPGTVKIDDGATPDENETEALEILSIHGNSVHFLKPVETRKSCDALVGGVRSEIKTITNKTKDGNETGRVREVLRKASRQNAERAILNIQKKVASQAIEDGIARYFKLHLSNINEIWYIQDRQIIKKERE